MWPSGESRSVWHASRPTIRAACVALLPTVVLNLATFAQDEPAEADAPFDPATFKEDERVVRLKEMWRAMATEIETADIEYLSLSTGSNLQPISADEFEELFLNVDFDDDPQRVFREEVAPVLFVDQHEPGHMWLRDAHFYVSGEWSRRDNWRGELHFVTRETEIRTQHHPQHRQIDLFKRGYSSYWRPDIDDFRWLPEPAAFQVVEQAEEGFLHLGAPLVGGAIRPRKPRAVIHRDSGIPQVKRGFLYDGRLSSVTIQRDLFSVGDSNVTLPRIVAEGRFNLETGLITLLRFQFIVEARINGDVPNDLFVLTTEPTDTIVDYRENRSDPFAFKAETSGVDIVDGVKTLTGIADNDQKHGPYLETDRTIVFIKGIDAWPEDVVGREVEVTGKLTMVVMPIRGPAAAQQLELESWSHADEDLDESR
jgi:hypothetical protein